MKVKHLIKNLKECNQNLPVFGFINDEIYCISIDKSILDRIDINLIEIKEYSYKKGSKTKNETN